MKKTILTIAMFAIVALVSCKKSSITPLPEPTKFENLYDTVGTGKRFIDVYVTNTYGTTKVFINNKVYASTTGSTVRGFNAYDNDIIRVECSNNSNSFIKININKNHTSVVDTSTNASNFFTASYLVH